MLMERNYEDIGARARTVVCTYAYDIGVSACQGHNPQLYLFTLPDKHRDKENLLYIWVNRVITHWWGGKRLAIHLR